LYTPVEMLREEELVLMFVSLLLDNFFVLWTILRLYKALSSFIHSIVSILLYKAICHLLFLIDNVDDNLYVQT